MRIITSGGNIVNLLGDYKVDIVDIVTSLSQIPRWTGHCKRYSVAQHSVLVSRLLPSHLAFQGLMHDAHEYITNDVSGPVKEVLEHLAPNSWNRFEHMIASKVRRHFSLPPDLHSMVKAVDTRVQAYEIASLFTPEAKQAAISIGLDIDYSRPIVPLSAEAAYDEFMHRYVELGPNYV